MNSASCSLAGIKVLCGLTFQLQYKEKALEPKGKLKMAVREHVRLKAGLIKDSSSLSQRWRINQLKTHPWPSPLPPAAIQGINGRPTALSGELERVRLVFHTRELNPYSCVLGISLEGCNVTSHHLLNLGYSSSYF